MRISDWSSDVCSSDLNPARNRAPPISEVRSAPVPLPTLSPPGQPLLRKAARPAFHKAADKPAPPVGPQPSARTTRQLPQRVKALQTMVLACAPVSSEEHTSELQSLMRNSYDVLCLKT